MSDYNKPKSICLCGHTGDGPNSRHAGTAVTPGHGACTAKDCTCIQFTWNGWTPEYEETLTPPDDDDEECEFCGRPWHRNHRCKGVLAQMREDMMNDDSPHGDFCRDAMNFADPGGDSALRAATPDNPRNLPCPTCGEPNRLTPADRAQGYQCNSCADALERGY